MKRLTLVSVLVSGLVFLISVSPASAEKRGVRVDGKEAADYVAERVGKSWAVVIGIDEYEHVRPLKYAVADAKAVAQTLRQRGFQVTELYDRQATRGHILGELGDKLVDRVGENDRVLIFYSGHGETKQPKGGKEMGFLLPVGAEADKLAETAIPMSVIRDLADELPSKHVLFLVDVCYGGIAGTQFKSVLKYDEAYLREITRERGRQLITAGGPKQEALEGPEWGHSVFTYYLLEGLNKGLADLDEDGIIPASELHTYLTRRVFDAAQLKGHRQRPEMWALAAEKGEFVFFTSAPGGGGPLPPARPSAPTLSAPPPKDVDVSGYDDLDAVAKLAEKRDQAWAKVQGFAGKTSVKRETRLAALDKFLQDFADDNPHVSEVEALKQQIQQELQVASIPTPSLPRQTGREITGKDNAPMMLVPEGEFLYGDNNQRLSLSAFYMDKYEVTTKLYAAFMQATGRAAPGRWNEASQVSDGDRPVIGVTWHDADAYCRHYGKRLPTEQEWEKAARGTDGREYPWGNEEPTSRHAKYNQDGKPSWKGYATLASVESYEAGKSPYGLYNMAGNVWEWTSSDYNSSSKVLRGGSWSLNAYGLLATLRIWDTPTYRIFTNGFRCAQDAS